MLSNALMECESHRLSVSGAISLALHMAVLAFLILDPADFSVAARERQTPVEVALVTLERTTVRRHVATAALKDVTTSEVASAREDKNPREVLPETLPETAFEAALPSERTLDLTALAGTMAQGGEENPRARYFSSILARLHRLKSYPSEARRRRKQGTVEVVFELLKDGRVVQARIRKPTDEEQLNQAALVAVSRLGRVPAIPDEISRGDLTLVVPFLFQLQ
ncbi:MAG: TonB family protein [Bdellovibrionaceae bacterium]|nr:TonB family protein [Pseudobdellovibrionaceae bacterium]